MARTFELFGEDYILSTAREIDVHLHQQIDEVAFRAKSLFDTEYSKLGDMDTLMKKGYDIGNAVLNNAADECVNILLEYDIYDITAKTIRENGRSEFANAFEPLADWYESTLEDEAQKDAYRKARRQNRGRFVGGGFGIGGAIKGAATAGALNMATGAVH